MFKKKKKPTKKGRERKKRQLGALICVNPGTLAGRSCRMWNISRGGCREQCLGTCRKVLAKRGAAFAAFGAAFPAPRGCGAARVGIPAARNSLSWSRVMSTSLGWDLELPSLSWAKSVRKFLKTSSWFEPWLRGLCCTLRAWTRGVWSWKLHALKCKIPSSVVKYHHKSLLWRWLKQGAVCYWRHWARQTNSWEHIWSVAALETGTVNIEMWANTES